MPSITTKVVTIFLALLAIGSYVAKEHYIATYQPDDLFVGEYWSYKHRGYPSRIGYLAQLWDVRLVETETEVFVESDTLTTAMHFRYFGKSTQIAEALIHFESTWKRSENNQIEFGVRPESIKVIQHTANIDNEDFKSFSRDMILTMFATPRQLIAASNNEVIMELPYMGIVRLLKIDEPHLLDIPRETEH
ncbi:hypothetical protein [uncultured Vibrio sp.]|uniref:hypothetical protein n=1 Tax=uncultured Vibrio sp. TaxID=114054 RepID=UPI00091028AC|nr:hypothetical protein [uncultured Vibrio sp.]OIQ26414.1 MAG: hypothetical protein BM561_01230 [Vibrio sp. MedPE-SWchi]